MNTKLRCATSDDRAFVEKVYFTTQRWIIEQLFGGWRGDDLELSKFAQFYSEKRTQIINIDGQDSGWIEIARNTDDMNINCIFIMPERQGRGVGSLLLRQAIREAVAAHTTLTISTAVINPARLLYERLGFTVVEETPYKVRMEYKAA